MLNIIVLLILVSGLQEYGHQCNMLIVPSLLQSMSDMLCEGNKLLRCFNIIYLVPKYPLLFQNRVSYPNQMYII